MEKLYPIVRRVRRPLLPPDEPRSREEAEKPIEKETSSEPTATPQPSAATESGDETQST